MGRGARRTAGVLAAAMTAAAGNVWFARTAGAVDVKVDERTVLFTFDVGATHVACDIWISSQWIPESRELTVTTAVTSTDPNCTATVDGTATAATAHATYTTAGGYETEANAIGGTRAQLHVLDAASRPRGLHFVYFAACDCATPQYVTSPK